MKFRLIVIAFFAAVFWSFSASSKPLDVSVENHEPIGKHVYFLQEDVSPLNLDEAIRAYAAGRFTASQHAFLNFGIGTRPVWLRFEVDNRDKTPMPRRLSIETSWLDMLDVYLLHRGEVLEDHHVGDRFPFSERAVASRFFEFDHLFQPGKTTVFIRIETPDPMVLPVYLTRVEEARSRQTLAGYSYGFVYGVISALLAYNLMLFFSLKSRRYLYYSIYLAAFLLMNIAYTGHGYRWLWPDMPRWQLWSNPLFMMLFSISGLAFATRFLNTKTAFPRLHRAVLLACVGFGGVELFAVFAGNHVTALLLSFFFVFLFSGGMVLLGAVSLTHGDKSARYFLLASITHVSTSMVTAMAVWGLIPYSMIAYRAVEIGMMIDAILLAMALAHQFRIVQEEKIEAEKLAKVDPLTAMNNRRGFCEFVKPVWNTGLRKRHDMSIIMLDIDRFKLINDTYGHVRGDEVLIHVASSLMEGARNGDVVARWGGEEFVIFLPETTLEDAATIAERFRHKISTTPLDIEGERITLTASFGVAHTVTASASIDDLVSAADKQLYLAKKQGRDRVCSAHLLS
ncbi:MAG: diguanylate cyclase [Granulosicoccaceae bacterium]|jgi:diguanylate cyclase (GGDEF)-like protein